MVDLNEYLQLITSEHQDKPKFVATVTASIEPMISLQNMMQTFAEAYDIDSAIGSQLDAVGEWIGISRNIPKPITGVYMEWDGSPTVGWNSGIWQGLFDPSSGLVKLPDENYRTLLKTKIVANRWDGSIPAAYAIWAAIFPNSQIVIQDNQNMTMTVEIVGSFLDAVSLALLVNGYIPLKPEGVRIDYFAVLPAEGLMFAWDIDASAPESGFDVGFDLDTPPTYFGGWDQGQWPLELQPIT